MTKPSLEDLKLPLKTVIAIVFYFASLAGIYFAMKSKVDSTADTVTELKTELQQYDLKTMDYKIDQAITTLNNIYTIELEKSKNQKK